MNRNPLIVSRARYKELEQVLGVTEAYLSGFSKGFSPWQARDARSNERTAVRAIVTPNEVNFAHGTGVLINRLFPDSSGCLHIRATDTYGGKQDFGEYNLVLAHGANSRAESFRQLSELVKDFDVTSIFLVPYYRDDFITAMILKHLYSVPLCTYLMDDTHLACHLVEDQLVREVLQHSDIRFAISREFADALQSKWRLQFWVAPAVVPSKLILSSPVSPNSSQRNRGVIIGNIWSQGWLEILQSTVKKASVTIDWFGGAINNLSQAQIDALACNGITFLGFAGTEDELCSKVQEYGYLVVPTGELNQNECLNAVAKFSLPSRITFASSVCNLPILVLGEPGTAAANFVAKMQIGESAQYEHFADAVNSILNPDNQRTYRENAARMAPTFSDEGMGQWLMESAQLHRPKDLRFEELLPKPNGSTVPYVDHEIPSDLYGDFAFVYRAFRRIKAAGYTPNFIVDVGASVGIWAQALSKLYPDSRYILVDPLYSHYGRDARTYYAPSASDVEIVEVAISNEVGTATFNVSGDLFGSSLVHPSDFREYEPVTVPVTTLDELASKKRITGRGVLKIDVQFAEHLVLAGAKQFLERADVLVLEMALVRYSPESRLFHEWLTELYDLGFEFYEDVGGWRDAGSGRQLEKDVVFVRRGVL